MSGPVEDLQREDSNFCLIDGTDGSEITRTTVSREAHRLSQTLHDWGLRAQESVLLLGATTVYPRSDSDGLCPPESSSDLS